MQRALQPVDPDCGAVCALDGRSVLVLGNDDDTNGMRWCADLSTGERLDVPRARLRLKTPGDQLGWSGIAARLEDWAQQGNSDAMWWLGWAYESRNPARSVWYYVAAMRRNPQRHAWAFERVLHDVQVPLRAVAAGHSRDSLSEVPEFAAYFRGEFRGSPADAWGSWKTAVRLARRTTRQRRTLSVETGHFS